MNKKSKYDGQVEVVAAPLIVNGQGEVLLIQSHKWGDQWLLPGGHVEYGETIFEAVVREAKEETGLEVEPQHSVNIGELIFDPSFERKAQLIFFHVLCQAKTEHVTLDPSELKNYRWQKAETWLAGEIEIRAHQTLQNFVDGVRINLNSKRWK